MTQPDRNKPGRLWRLGLSQSPRGTSIRRPGARQGVAVTVTAAPTDSRLRVGGEPQCTSASGTRPGFQWRRESSGRPWAGPPAGARIAGRPLATLADPLRKTPRMPGLLIGPGPGRGGLTQAPEDTPLRVRGPRCLPRGREPAPAQPWVATQVPAGGFGEVLRSKRRRAPFPFVLTSGIPAQHCVHG